MKTLLDFYKSHTGKVSDKWALYLREYDRLFAPYREKAISMLEIGIQNGGSLEIWSQYFPNAQKFVGCDINPDCAKLSYDDPRITVIVGDATTPETQAQVLAQSATFDLIIEDGSHTSSDIVKAFARYFPTIKNGGLFVAEDLHCSYWKEYEGGIFHPYSSITFFKHLADMVNHQHWGVEKNRADLIDGFKQMLGVEIDEWVLSQISSVEFGNSICVVRKSDQTLNILGGRVIAGSTELVVGGHLSIAGTVLASPNQSTNIWSNLPKAPAETYLDLVNQIEISKELLAQERFGANQLRVDLQAKNSELGHLTQLVTAIQDSRSWRYTAALREVGSLVRPVVRLWRRIKNAARNKGGYSVLVSKAIAIVRREGWHGVRRRLSNQPNTGLVVTPDGEAVDRNDYQTWLKLYDTLDSEAVERIKADVAVFSTCPKISVVMPVYNAPLNFLREAIESVQAQLYPHWELCIADDASTDKMIRPLLEEFAKQDSRIRVVFRENNGHISEASNSALKLATGDFVALLDNDDLLTKHALYHMAKAILANPDAELFYSDEDKLDFNGVRCMPLFKPDWSPHLALSQAYLGHLVCYRTTIVREIDGFRPGYDGSQDYDLWLRASLKAQRIVHIPKVLYHWRMHVDSTAATPDAKPYAHDAGRRALRDYVALRYPQAPVEIIDGAHTFTYELKSTLPNDLKISIIIPTRNRIDLLRPCVASILEKSSWQNFEILILDNGSDDPATLTWMKEISNHDTRVCVIPADIEFNWSRLNNIGAAEATGSVLLFMNNDTVVISSNWLEKLAGYALLPDVGVVGALLLFEDGTIQHSGVVVGMGGWADHVYRTRPAAHLSGPFISPILTRNTLAVTGACAAISAQRFHEVGGFDENFVVCGSDVEICLRTHARGWYNVVVGEVSLFHFESKSRDPAKIPDIDFELSALKYEPFRTECVDPYFNPNLSLAATTPMLEIERVQRA